MDEYISKIAVLDVMDRANLMWYFDTEGDYQELLKDTKRIPVANVQTVKLGKWIRVKNYRDCEGDIYSQYKCSCCDFCVGGVYSNEDLTHFCGNCGARMNLEEGDTDG